MSKVLQRRVLVLNKHWRPVAVVSVKKALNLCLGSYKDNNEPKAKIIDPTQEFRAFTWNDWSELKLQENEEGIFSSSQGFKVPKVVILTRFAKFITRQVHFNRITIFRRDNFTCQYCGKKPGSKELSLDHITPLCKFGATTWTNVVVACLKCNCKKAGKTLEAAKMTLLKQPTKPNFTIFQTGHWLEEWSPFITPQQLLDIGYWETELENDN